MMSAPAEGTGRGDGPIGPWGHTSWSIRDLALIVLIAIWAIAAIFAVLALALVDSLARAVLPPRLRDRYWHPSAQIPRNVRPVAGPWLSANCGRQARSGTAGVASVWIMSLTRACAPIAQNYSDG